MKTMSCIIGEKRSRERRKRLKYRKMREIGKGFTKRGKQRFGPRKNQLPQPIKKHQKLRMK